MMGIGLQVYMTHNEKAVADGILTITVITGGIITIFVFLFELFMEFLEDLRNRARSKEGTHGKPGDSTNN